jgi:hypothetical protein
VRDSNANGDIAAVAIAKEVCLLDFELLQEGDGVLKNIVSVRLFSFFIASSPIKSLRSDLWGTFGSSG